MKISIVTISYNQERFLEQAILSVLEQDYPDIEYIVVDPGSIDGSREVIEKHRGRIAKIILEPDQGPADGLNKGFAAATGDVFGFLNADDYLLPGSIRLIADYFKKNGNIDVVSAHGYVVDDVGKKLRAAHSGRMCRLMYAYGAVILFQQSTYFRRKTFDMAGNFNVNNHTCWDGELWADMLLSGARFGRIHEYLSAFRIHPNSISGSGRLLVSFIQDQEKICHKLGILKNSGISQKFFWLSNIISDPVLLWLKMADRWFGSYENC